MERNEHVPLRLPLMLISPITPRGAATALKVTVRFRTMLLKEKVERHSAGILSQLHRN